MLFIVCKLTGYVCGPIAAFGQVTNLAIYNINTSLNLLWAIPHSAGTYDMYTLALQILCIVGATFGAMY